MDDNVHSLALDVLKQSQSGFAEMIERLDRIENISREHRRDSAGALVMMRATAGDFDARIAEIAERVATFEGERRI